MSDPTLPTALFDPVREQRALLGRRVLAMRRLRDDLLRNDARLPTPLLTAAFDDPDARDQVAAWIQRFGLLVDLLAASMKALVAYEGDRVDSFLDVLAAMAKVGVVDDENTWRALRALRNRLAHEYEVDAARLARDLQGGRALLPSLMGVLDRFEARCRYAIGSVDEAGAVGRGGSESLGHPDRPGGGPAS